jgi:Ca2+-binding RTX toxin-like protein
MAIDLTNIGFHADSMFESNGRYLLTGWDNLPPHSLGLTFLLDENGNILQSFSFDSSLIVNGCIFPDGSIVIQEEGYRARDNQNSLRKFNKDGVEDLSFSANANVFNHSGSSFMIPDGNGGVFVGFYNNSIVQHFNSDGTFDSTFGSPSIGGRVSNAVLHNDKLYVVGGSNSLQVNVLNLDGSPSNIFNGNSTNVISYIHNDGSSEVIPGGASSAGGIICLADNSFIVLGNQPNESDRAAITLVKFNSDGSIDTSFGINGVTQTSVLGGDLNCVGSGYHSGFAFNDTAIYVTANNGGNCYIAKYNYDGQIDQSFTDFINSNLPDSLSRGSNDSYRNFFISIQGDGDIAVFGTAAYGDAEWDNSQNVAIFDSSGNLKKTIFSDEGTVTGNDGEVIDVITGGNSADTINGLSGDDVIIGGAGNDILTGGTGADVLMGGTGNDTINGGTGVDTLDFSDVTTAVVVNLTAGTATGDGTDTLTGIENAVGGAGNDTLTANNTTGSELDGGAGSDTLNGGTAADVLYGGDGNDIVNAGAGNDLIIGGDGAGNDTYNGGDGIDTVKYTSALASITVDLSTTIGTATSTAGNDASHIGNDTLTGIENIIAGNYNDILTGSSLDNAFTGESGNDTINGGTGNDTAIYKGTKAQYNITNNNNGTWTVADTVAGRDDTDIISNIEYLQFTDQTFSLVATPPKTLTGTSSANTLTGGAGNDILIGLGGTDALNGGAGSDLYVMTSASDHTAAEINDTGASGIDEVRFTTTTASTLNLYALDRGIESVTIGTGTAASAVTTGTTANSINAALVANALSITGNNGNNTLTGTAYADTLTGNAGNDTLNGGAGADTLVGGAGNDTYVIDNAGDAITENVSEGTDLVQVAITTAAGTYTLGSNVENATLTNTVAYNLTGNSLNNTLTGNAAANILDGGTGIDTLVGGAGNDTYLVDIITASGALQDTVTEASNAGTDTIQLRGSYSGVLANLTLAANFENLDISNTGSSLYNLTGNTANNALTGNAANNILNGGTGTDRLVGGTGDDTYVVDSTTDTITENASAGTDLVQSSVTFSLANIANVENLTLSGTSAINGTGNTLDNTLTGNTGANTLNGGNGNDMLYGGLGNDTLTGGAGADHFVFNTTLNASSNRDTITDFVSGTDKIDLENAVMTALGPTTGSLTTDQFFSSSTAVRGNDATDRIVYNTTTGALYYDADGSGNGAAIQIALMGLSIHPTMTYQDFLIV